MVSKVSVLATPEIEPDEQSNLCARAGNPQLSISGCHQSSASVPLAILP
jgi:hypothetical protein